jgi:hypothetical protein
MKLPSRNKIKRRRKQRKPSPSTQQTTSNLSIRMIVDSQLKTGILDAILSSCSNKNIITPIRFDSCAAKHISLRSTSFMGAEGSKT